MAIYYLDPSADQLYKSTRKPNPRQMSRLQCIKLDSNSRVSLPSNSFPARSLIKPSGNHWFGYRYLQARSYSTTCTNARPPLHHNNQSSSKSSLSSGSSNVSCLTASSSTDLLHLPVPATLAAASPTQSTSAPPPTPSLPVTAWPEKFKPAPSPPPPSISSSSCESSSHENWRGPNDIPSPQLSDSSEKLCPLDSHPDNPLSSANSSESLHSKFEFNEDILNPPSSKGYESDCSEELSRNEWWSLASSNLGRYDSSTSTGDSSFWSYFTDDDSSSECYSIPESQKSLQKDKKPSFNFPYTNPLRTVGDPIFRAKLTHLKLYTGDTRRKERLPPSCYGYRVKRRKQIPRIISNTFMRTSEGNYRAQSEVLSCSTETGSSSTQQNGGRVSTSRPKLTNGDVNKPIRLTMRTLSRGNHVVSAKGWTRKMKLNQSPHISKPFSQVGGKRKPSGGSNRPRTASSRPATSQLACKRSSAQTNKRPKTANSCKSKSAKKSVSNSASSLLGSLMEMIKNTPEKKLQENIRPREDRPTSSKKDNYVNFLPDSSKATDSTKADNGSCCEENLNSTLRLVNLKETSSSICALTDNYLLSSPQTTFNKDKTLSTDESSINSSSDDSKAAPTSTDTALSAAKLELSPPSQEALNLEVTTHRVNVSSEALRSKSSTSTSTTTKKKNKKTKRRSLPQPVGVAVPDTIQQTSLSSTEQAKPRQSTRKREKAKETKSSNQSQKGKCTEKPKSMVVEPSISTSPKFDAEKLSSHILGSAKTLPTAGKLASPREPCSNYVPVTKPKDLCSSDKGLKPPDKDLCSSDKGLKPPDKAVKGQDSILMKYSKLESKTTEREKITKPAVSVSSDKMHQFIPSISVTQYLDANKETLKRNSMQGSSTTSSKSRKFPSTEPRKSSSLASTTNTNRSTHSNSLEVPTKVKQHKPRSSNRNSFANLPSASSVVTMPSLSSVETLPMSSSSVVTLPMSSLSVETLPSPSSVVTLPMSSSSVVTLPTSSLSVETLPSPSSVVTLPTSSSSVVTLLLSHSSANLKLTGHTTTERKEKRAAATSADFLAIDQQPSNTTFLSVPAIAAALETESSSSDLSVTPAVSETQLPEDRVKFESNEGSTSSTKRPNEGSANSTKSQSKKKISKAKKNTKCKTKAKKT